ncbi:MAG: hypothetical protein H7A53_08150 [Akkermansiaceae bacterium]|nr:hypothetical protein [Akkermansiaceae bacterium]
MPRGFVARGQRPPLAGREAWIEGKNERATARSPPENGGSRRRHPTTTGPTRIWVDWHQRDERPDDAIREARHPIRLRWPSGTGAARILADLLMNRNDTEGAWAEREAASASLR